jgi:hypothetical protein
VVEDATKAVRVVEREDLAVSAKTNQEAAVNYSLLNTLVTGDNNRFGGRAYLLTKQQRPINPSNVEIVINI